MGPEVLHISSDANEADTSGDEVEEEKGGVLFDSASSSENQLENPENEGIQKLFKDWERPSIPEGTLVYSSSGNVPQPDKFKFLLLDSVSTLTSFKHEKINLDEGVQAIPVHNVIRLFGLARIPVYSSSQDLFDEPDFLSPADFDLNDSASVCVNVHGFLPYFYAFPLETSFFLHEGSNGVAAFDTMKTRLIKALNKKVSEWILEDLAFIQYHELITSGHSPVVRVEGVELRNIQNNIFDFPTYRDREPDSLVLKIYVSLPRFTSITGRAMITLEEPCSFNIFEINLTQNIRFLADRNLPGSTWLELEPSKYYTRTGDSLPLESHCQLELDVHFSSISILDPQPTDIPPLRVLSFDLECRLNNSKASEVIQIGCVLTTYSSSLTNPVYKRACFVLGTCATLADTIIVQCGSKSTSKTYSNESEAELLSSFRDFVIQMDPDIITGYNIKNFDFPHLFSRASSLNDLQTAQRFPYLGRLRKIKAFIRPVLNKSKRMYRFDSKIVNCQGRVVMDMYLLFQRHTIGKQVLKLKNVAQQYLQVGEEKDDVKYTEINGLQDGNDITRQRLAKYCVQDSYLPLKLMRVALPDRKTGQDFMEYYWEQAKCGGTILRYLVNKSRDYNKYFKHVRVQKNNGRVKYHPDSPSPKKQPPIKEESKASIQKSKTVRNKNVKKMLFPDDDVRVIKNNECGKYHPDSPNPKKELPIKVESEALVGSTDINQTQIQAPIQKPKAVRKNVKKMIFTDDDD